MIYMMTMMIIMMMGIVRRIEEEIPMEGEVGGDTDSYANV